MKTLSESHKKLRTLCWQASAVMFALFLLDMFILQRGPLFTDLFLLIFGFTMIVDGTASIREKHFAYFGMTMAEPFAQIAGGIIVFVGIVLAYGGAISLVG